MTSSVAEDFGTSESYERPYTDRRTQRTTGDTVENEEITSRLCRQGAHANNVSQEYLFSLFVALAAEIHKSTTASGDTFVEHLLNKDAGLINVHTKLIGRGRSFCVRLFEDQYSDKNFVIKSVLPFANFSDREQKERLRDVILELRALSHRPLRGHSNIVDLLGLCWETDSSHLEQKWPALILEYADGGSLRDYLQREDKDPTSLLSLCSNIASGIKALHESAIVHGDLKPDNVLIFQTSSSPPRTIKVKAKLADFGGSVLDVEENGRGRLSMGTFPWQAPEWNDWLTRDELLRTDLYSLGLVIWCVIASGHEPMASEIEVTEFSSFKKRGESLQQAVQDLKAQENPTFLSHLITMGGKKFSPDVDQDLIYQALSVTVQKDSSVRDIDALCSLLRNGVSISMRDETSDLGIILPPSSCPIRAFDKITPITTITRIDEILVCRNFCQCSVQNGKL
jgi:serine/threonine protein kinase